MINSELHFTLEEILPKFSEDFQKKIVYSVELLRKAEKLALAYDRENGYYNTFSGGKDSQCLYHVAKIAGVKFQTHMNLTSVDPPEVIRFVRKQYPDVELVKPKDSIFNLAVKKNILPTMAVRWCCKEFKEDAGAGKVALIGIRHAESIRRSKRNEVEISGRKFSGTLDELDSYRDERTKRINDKHKRGRKPDSESIVNAEGERTLGCIGGKETLLISPIINWTNDEVWTFLNTLGIAHCELYDEGWHRIGCIGCPMSSPKQKVIENKRWPHVKRNWIKAIKAIRNGGDSKENISGGTSARTGCLSETSEDCSEVRLQLCTHRPRTLDGRGGIIGSPNPRYVINPKWLQTPSQFLPKGHLESKTGFSSSSSSDRLTEEQENEIAENIYDWWISGKPYKQWYTEKFQQMKLDFKD